MKNINRNSGAQAVKIVVGVLAATVVIAALGAVVALGGGTSTRLNDTVVVGLGGSSTKTITFDAGVSPNPLISATSSKTIGINTTTPAGTLGVAYPDVSSDVTTFATRSGSSTGSQRWKFMPPSGSTPQFEIDGDFSTSPNQMTFQSDSTAIMSMQRSGLVSTYHGLSVAADLAVGTNATVTGTLAVTGATTLGLTGGNVPHSCIVRNTTCNSVTTCDLSCSAGEIVTGGGCNTGTSGVQVRETVPLSSTSWRCNTSTTNDLTTFAVCCSY